MSQISGANSKKTQDSNNFELKAGEIVAAVGKKNFNIYADHHSKELGVNKLGTDMEKDRINPEINSEKSRPDMILTVKDNKGGLKSLVVEVKSHSGKIAKADINKVIEDCSLRKCHGLLIIKEDSIIGDKNMQRLIDSNISVMRIKPSEDGQYDTFSNRKIIQQAIDDRMEPNKSVDILLNQNGTINKQCKAYKDGNIILDGDKISDNSPYIQDGTIKKTITGQVDRRGKYILEQLRNKEFNDRDPVTNIVQRPEILMTKDFSAIKQNCKAVINGYVVYKNGKIDPNCQAVVDGVIVLNVTGEIDKKKSEAVQQYKKYKTNKPTLPAKHSKSNKNIEEEEKTGPDSVYEKETQASTTNEKLDQKKVDNVIKQSKQDYQEEKNSSHWKPSEHGGLTKEGKMDKRMSKDNICTNESKPSQTIAFSQQELTSTHKPYYKPSEHGGYRKDGGIDQRMSKGSNNENSTTSSTQKASETTHTGPSPFYEKPTSSYSSQPSTTSSYSTHSTSTCSTPSYTAPSASISSYTAPAVTTSNSSSGYWRPSEHGGLTRSGQPDRRCTK